MNVSEAVPVDEPINAPANEATARPRPLAGFGHQLRFMIRRDRVRMPVWTISVVGLVAVSTASVLALYQTPAELADYARLARADVAFKALSGPGYGLDDPTPGAVVMNETSLYTYVAVALMGIFMLVRHTRAEEDSDRAELVHAAPIGRSATLAAAVVWVSTIAFVIGLGLAAVLVANDLAISGSIAFGAATWMSGTVFVGVAALAAQVASSGRAANSIAGAVLGLSFMLRAVGDMGTGWLTWTSPIGVAQAIRPFADERWWVLIPLALLTVVLLSAAVVLLGRRDLGAGFIGQPSGRATAHPRLATPLALAGRLQRASIIGWTCGLAISAFAFGLVADQADAFADNEAIAEIFAQSGEGTFTEAFLATLIAMMAILTSGFTVGSVLRLRTEEAAGRGDPLLAAPVTRVRWLWSHVGVAVGATLLMMIVVGAMTGAGYALRVGDPGEVMALVAASVTMTSALIVLAAITAALVAISPRWSIAAWALVALATVVAFLADTLGLPQWIRDLSPFEHVPAMPAESFAIVPVAGLVAVAALVVGAAMIPIRHRDFG